MSDLEEVTSEKKSGISRRTVAKGMAWSVPAVALAVAAPAYAASPCTPVFSFGAASCKCPGGSDPIKFGYVLQFCFTVAAQCALPPGDTNARIIAIENNSGKPLNPLERPVSHRRPDHRRSELLERRGPLRVESSASTLIISYQINGAGPVLTQEVPAPPQDCPSCVPPTP